MKQMLFVNYKEMIAFLKDQRLRFGYTQEYIAKKIGVVTSAVSQYENGSRKMRQDITEKYANVFGYASSFCLTKRALDASTTEAIIADWARYSLEHNINFENAQKVTRFLRERLRQ